MIQSKAGFALVNKRLADLTPDTRNANKGTERGQHLIEQSLRDYGAGRSILIDKHGAIIAGNKTAENCGSIGMEDVLVVQTDGTRLVAVQRMDLDLATDKTAKELAIADNRAAQVSLDWDAEVLKELDIDLAKFWSPDELAALLKEAEVIPALLTDEDDVPPVPEEPVTKLGDMYLLGNHRLLCGDSTSIGDVERLMDGQRAGLCFTSPPYADQREYNGGKELSTEHLATFIRTAQDCVDIFAVNLGIVRRDGAISRYWDDYIAEAEACGLKLLSWNIWDRLYPASIAQQTAMFPVEHEWVFVFGRGPHDLNPTVTNKYAGGEVGSSSNRQADGTLKRQKRRSIAETRALGTVLVCDINRGKADHPAVFPVAFAEAYVEAVAMSGSVVYEPFGGSGSTLIACEKTGRHARLMELDPKYCDVIVKRWEDATGKKAVLNGSTT